MSRLLRICWCKQRCHINILDDQYEVRKLAATRMTCINLPFRGTLRFVICNILQRNGEAGELVGQSNVVQESSLGFYLNQLDLYVDQGLQNVTCTGEEMS